LKQGLYTFTIKNFNKESKVSSVAAVVSGRSYRANYGETLTGQIVKQAIYSVNDKSLDIKWDDFPEATSRGIPLFTEVTYTDLKGNKQNLKFRKQDTLSLSNFDFTEQFKYTTAYLPDSAAIDTFYTPTQNQGLTEIQLLNQGPDFDRRQDNGGSRWGDPKDWKINDAIKTRGGPDGTMVGGFDSFQGPGHLGAERWSTSEGIITNGKIYQTVTLPAGTYSFNAYFNNSGSSLALGSDPEAEYYLVVTKQDTLPDIENIKSHSIAYAFLEQPVTVEFSLNKKTKVTLGFVATLKGNSQNFRCSKVRLKVLDEE
jgi:hypothetical protein